MYTAIANDGKRRKFDTIQQAEAWLGNWNERGELISYPARGGYVVAPDDTVISGVGADGGAVRHNQPKWGN